MKKYLIPLIIIAVVIVLFGKVHFGDAIALFLLAGVIPGTNTSMSPTEVMGACALIIGFVLARVITPAIRFLVSTLLKKTIRPTTQARKA